MARNLWPRNLRTVASDRRERLENLRNRSGYTDK